MPNAACEVFHAWQWKKVVGTLSGDETFLIRDPLGSGTQRAICSELTSHYRADIYAGVN